MNEELNIELLKEIIEWSEKYRDKLPGLYEFYKLESEEVINSFVQARKRVMKRPGKTNCEICGKLIEGEAIHWDYEHESKAFRGWLCMDCDLKLGAVESFLRRGLIHKVVEYLMRSKNLEPQTA